MQFPILKSPGDRAFDALYLLLAKRGERNLDSRTNLISCRSVEEISLITNRGRAARISRRRAALALPCVALRVCVHVAHLCAHVRTVERQDLDISCNEL